MSLKYNKRNGDLDGRKRYRALEELKYLHLAYSTKSPYRDYSDNERLEESKKDCGFSSNWEESTELKLLIPKFIKGTTSKLARLLQTTESVLDKLDSYYKTIDFSLGAENRVEPKEVIESLNKLPKLAQTLQELERQVKTGSVGTTKSKGDHETGWIMDNNVNERQREDE